MPDPTKPAILVTSADHNHFSFLKELITSVRAAGGADLVDLGCYDIGLTDDQRAYMQTQGVRIVQPVTGLKVADLDKRTSQLGSLARPYLPQNFPGYTTYVWLDSDAWIQSAQALRGLIEGANQTGAAYIREDDPTYRSQLWLFPWKFKHYVLGYGPWLGLQMLFKRQINNGVFAMRADAPHWAVWRKYYQAALSRTGVAAPQDQFSLNVTAYFGKLEIKFLPAVFNWICDLSHPEWDEDGKCFCTPDGTRRRIEIIHLAGPIKKTVFDTRTSRGRILRGMLRYGAVLEPQPAEAVAVSP